MLDDYHVITAPAIHIATMPLVAMVGVAGPVVAASTRTGVGGLARQAPRACCSRRALRTVANDRPVTGRLLQDSSWCSLQRQRSGGRGVIQLRLSCEQVEQRDVEIELRAGEAVRESMNSTWLMTPSSRLRPAMRKPALAASTRARAVAMESLVVCSRSSACCTSSWICRAASSRRVAACRAATRALRASARRAPPSKNCQFSSSETIPKFRPRPNSYSSPWMPPSTPRESVGLRSALRELDCGARRRALRCPADRARGGSRVRPYGGWKDLRQRVRSRALPLAAIELRLRAGCCAGS